MNYLEKLLEGVEVEWMPLCEVADLKRGKTITAKNKRDGDIPVISGGQKPAYYNAEYNRDGETITVAGSGAYAGTVMYWNEPIFVSDAFSVKPKMDSLSIKYLYHFLLKEQTTIYNFKKGSGVPHVYPKDLGNIQIPIPCPENPEKSLKIQKEIVRILDTFTELTAELTTMLTAEFAARDKQYSYYREQMIGFEEKHVEWKFLGEVCDFQNGFAFKSKLFKASGLPIVRITNIDGSNVDLKDVKYFDPADYKIGNPLNYSIQKGDILIAMSGATTGKIGYYNFNETAYLNQRVGKFIPHKTLLNNRYLYHFLQTKSDFFYVLAGGGAQPNLSSTNIKEKFPIPIPPSEEQVRIVSILDKFDTLTTSITEGLPKEIELRQKQYEYYRNKLLSFR